MNTANPIIQASARERLGTAPACAAHQATPPSLHGGIDSGASPGARNDAGLPWPQYQTEARQMGYVQLCGGHWRHPRLGFDVEAIRVEGSTFVVARAATLERLRMALHQHQANAHHRRYWAGVAVLAAALVVALLVLLWPTSASAGTARDEIERQVQMELERGTPIARCDHAYTLAAHATITVECFHAGVLGKARVSAESGNAWVQATVARTRHRPGYAQITLHNLSHAPAQGTSVVEFWHP